MFDKYEILLLEFFAIFAMHFLNANFPNVILWDSI